MEGTILSESLCDFIPYIKKNEGIVASNWPRQISSQPSQIMMHVRFEGCGAVKINSAVFRDVTACTGNVVDRYYLGLLFYPEHGSKELNRKFDVVIPN
jgi:hypothetical protein